MYSPSNSSGLWLEHKIKHMKRAKNMAVHMYTIFSFTNQIRIIFLPTIILLLWCPLPTHHTTFLGAIEHTPDNKYLFWNMNYSAARFTQHVVINITLGAKLHYFLFDLIAATKNTLVIWCLVQWSSKHFGLRTQFTFLKMTVFCLGILYLSLCTYFIRN